MRFLTVILTAALIVAPAPALAWGNEGHEVVATIARGYLIAGVRAKVDALLASDPDTLTAHDMADEATWADAYRAAGHRETASWHFVDVELVTAGARGARIAMETSSILKTHASYNVGLSDIQVYRSNPL